MKKQTTIITGLFLIITSASLWYVLSCLNQPIIVAESFEDGLVGWTKGADVPYDPNRPGQMIEWKIENTTLISHGGLKSVKLFIDGRQDDGTIWLEKSVKTWGSSSIEAELSFWLYSENESFNTLSVAVASIQSNGPSKSESDFEVLGSAEQNAGWTRFSYKKILITNESGDTWISLGISVRWESYITHIIDDVEIRVIRR